MRHCRAEEHSSGCEAIYVLSDTTPVATMPGNYISPLFAQTVVAGVQPRRRSDRAKTRSMSTSFLSAVRPYIFETFHAHAKATGLVGFSRGLAKWKLHHVLLIRHDSVLATLRPILDETRTEDSGQRVMWIETGTRHTILHGVMIGPSHLPMMCVQGVDSRKLGIYAQPPRVLDGITNHQAGEYEAKGGTTHTSHFRNPKQHRQGVHLNKRDRGTCRPDDSRPRLC